MQHTHKRGVKDYVYTIGVAIGIAVLIRSYIVEAYRIPTFSMSPTLLAGDNIFVWKWPFQFRKYLYRPTRGEVIVYSSTGPSGNFTLDSIRRIIGLPGDLVELKGGHVVLNGNPLSPLSKEPDSLEAEGPKCFTETIPDGISYEACKEDPLPLDMPMQKIPPGSLFVIGDMRSQIESKKNKIGSVISIANIKGQAWMIWLSIDHEKQMNQKNQWTPAIRWNRLFQWIK